MNSHYKTKSPWMGRTFIFLISILLIIICLFPLYFVVINSSKTRGEYATSKFSLPKNFTLFEKAKKLFELGFGNYTLNTIAVVTIGVFISLVFCSMAGYAFDKLELPGKNLIYLGVISLLAIPFQAFIIPLYVMWSRWGLVDNLVMMGILHATLAFPFGTFLMRSFYHNIPDELMDSAKVDGANSFQIYLKIMVPLGKPALLTLGVINFFDFWNELFISMIFLRSHEVRVITPAIAQLQASAKAGRVTDWPLLFSGVLVSIIIPLLIYFIFQRRLAEGITMGALKG